MHAAASHLSSVRASIFCSLFGLSPAVGVYYHDSSEVLAGSGAALILLVNAVVSSVVVGGSYFRSDEATADCAPIRLYWARCLFVLVQSCIYLGVYLGAIIALFDEGDRVMEVKISVVMLSINVMIGALAGVKLAYLAPLSPLALAAIVVFLGRAQEALDLLGALSWPVWALLTGGTLCLSWIALVIGRPTVNGARPIL